MKVLLSIFLLAAACVAPGTTRVRLERVAEEAGQALAAVPAHLAARGPLGWVELCDDAPDFCMAVEGEMKFATFAALREAMTTFGPTVARMELAWIEPRVDALTPDLATFATGYDEVLAMQAGQELHFAGYVTGILRRTPRGWRIARLHWSASVSVIDAPFPSKLPTALGLSSQARE